MNDLSLSKSRFHRLRLYTLLIPLVGLIACSKEVEPETEPDPEPQTEIQTCSTQSESCGPHSTCVDLEPGSFDGTVGYSCECDEGFAPDKGDCVDADECAEGFHDCNMNATCSNTEGSYTCTCNEGYEGDGNTCELPALSAEVIELAGRYLTAQRALREAIIFGSDDTSMDLDNDGTLSVLDMIAARCIAYSESSGLLFEHMSRGCPISGEVQNARLLALAPMVETECTLDSDCTGQSPGTARCTSPEATCRCLPIGRSGLSECQPQFP